MTVVTHLFSVTIQVEGTPAAVLLIEAESSTQALQTVLAQLSSVQACVQVESLNVPQQEARPQ